MPKERRMRERSLFEREAYASVLERRTRVKARGGSAGRERTRRWRGSGPGGRMPLWRATEDRFAAKGKEAWKTSAGSSSGEGSRIGKGVPGGRAGGSGCAGTEGRRDLRVVKLRARPSPMQMAQVDHEGPVRGGRIMEVRVPASRLRAVAFVELRMM